MIKAIDRLFKRLSATYGARWDSSLGNTPVNDVKTVWAHELDAFKNSLHRVAWALENLPERCPNVIEFKNLCRSAPAPDELALPEPKADPARVRVELEKLAISGAAARAMPTDRLDWARRILQTVEDGAKRTPTVVKMARDALAGV